MVPTLERLRFLVPRSLAVDAKSIWIALREGNSIWRIDRGAGTIHHVAGSGRKGYSGDGGDPLEATFNGPKGLVIDDQKRLLVVDTENHAVRRIDLSRRVVETVLGGTAAEREHNFRLKRPHGISFSAGTRLSGGGFRKPPCAAGKMTAGEQLPNELVYLRVLNVLQLDLRLGELFFELIDPCWVTAVRVTFRSFNAVRPSR